MTSYQARSPTRVDLAGGTLDCWPLYLLVGDSVTVNLAVSIYTHVELQVKDGRKIEVYLRDLNFRRSFDSLGDLLRDRSSELALLQMQCAYWRPATGFKIETFSESPVGGGLGGSSSLCISLIKVFSQWLENGAIREMHKVVELAHNLEAQVLGKMTGTQDYFPALSPGLCAIHYTPEGPRLESLGSQSEFWDAHLSLVYTGQPHQSGLNNWQVLKAALDQDQATLSALREIRKVALDTYAAIVAKDWAALPKLLAEEFDARVKLSPVFSSPEIERLRSVALRSGAEAVKICGAGGGGCVLIWSPPDRKEKVNKECREQGFVVLEAKSVL
jgi:D-glycero-alpha-D-manno-heptose-7-phosphate kinase